MRLLALVGAAFLLAAPALGAPLDDAQSAYGAGDFPKAVELFRALAERGNPVAQYNLGVLYENGQGLPKDYKLAAEWYRKGADQGYSEAQNNLANMYAFGLGVEKNPAEAVVWMRKAAQQGQAGAQLNLGIMYTLGQGVPKNYAQAEAWLRLAAEQGEPDAQYNLGVMYEHGDGVAADPVEAYVWYGAASIHGSAPAQEKMSAIGATLTEAQRKRLELLISRRKADAASAPPSKSGRGRGAAGLIALGALAATAWKFRRRTAAPAGVPNAPIAKGFNPLDEPALLRAAEDPAVCEKVARIYIGAGRMSELAAKKPERTPKFYGAYGRAFLKLGELSGAISMLELIETPGAGDGTLIWTLQKAVVDQGSAKEWSWSARLSTAMDLSMQGLHDEALSLVDDEMLKEIADNVSAAARVAALYAAAKRPRPRR
jgi:TPR repeat protein